MTEAVILIPGIMGSVLKDGDSIIWPGNPLELVLPYGHMNELLKPDLVASDVIRNFSISSQYSDLIDSLEQCGFCENCSIPTLKVFPYDWRKDNSHAALGLANCIDDLVESLGNDCEISLVAHSMGGLVSRYYLESGSYISRPGFKNIVRLITLGTPHRGSPMALSAALGNEKRLFLNAKQVQQVANNICFPSLYQLLPPKGEPFAWDRNNIARFNPIDIYDPIIATQLSLNQQNLNSASVFHSKLDLGKRPQHVRYFFFAGTRQTTTNSVQMVLSQHNPAKVLKIDREDSGDGTVPIWSGSQSGVQMEPVGGEHGEIYKNGTLKSTLAILLGKPGVLLAAGAIPELSVRQKVVNPSQDIQVTIDLPKGTFSVKGKLDLRRLIDSQGHNITDVVTNNEYEVVYNGPQIDHLSVLIRSPEYAGIYELLYEDSNSGTVAKTEVFVQEI